MGQMAWPSVPAFMLNTLRACLWYHFRAHPPFSGVKQGVWGAFHRRTAAHLTKVPIGPPQEGCPSVFPLVKKRYIRRVKRGSELCEARSLEEALRGCLTALFGLSSASCV